METKLLKEENVYKDKTRICTRTIEQTRTVADDYKQLGNTYFQIGEILAGETQTDPSQVGTAVKELLNVAKLLIDFINGYDKEENNETNK